MADEDDRQEKDDVGPGRPPRNGRFPPGVSGNPNGRPKGSVNLRTMVDRELRKRVPVTRNGKRVTISKGELLAIQLVDAAAKGDFKSAIFAMRLDDERTVATANSSTVETGGLPGKEQLRFILERVRHLAEGDE